MLFLLFSIAAVNVICYTAQLKYVFRLEENTNNNLITFDTYVIRS